ncbi:unnamed protein product [Chrysoparadoxa australica]
MERRADTDIELQKLGEEKIYPGDWTETSCNLLEKWLRDCKEKQAKHMLASKAHKRKHLVLAIPSLLVGITASSLAFRASATQCTDQQESGTAIAVSVLTALGSALSGLTALFDHSATKEKHIATAGAYANVAKQIEMEVRLPDGRKSDIQVVFVSVFDQMAAITTTAPLL